MTAHNRENVGIILLAAGGSSRFGTPKQLFIFEGKSLLRRAAERAAAAAQTVVVVLGSNAKEAKTELGDLNINTCVNGNWAEGLSSSIRAGLDSILKIEPAISGAAIVLCDQPFVTTEQIDHLIQHFRAADSLIVASRYDETIGVPAVFSADLFDELCRLEGDKGARALIQKHISQVTFIELPEAGIDIDTPDDIAKARGSPSN